MTLQQRLHDTQDYQGALFEKEPAIKNLLVSVLKFLQPYLLKITTPSQRNSVVHGVMGCGKKKTHQLLSEFLAKGHLPRVSRQSANVREIKKLYRGLSTGLLAFSLQLRKFPSILSQEAADEGSATNHRLKWGAFPTNEAGRIAQQTRKREGWKEGKDGVLSARCYPDLEYYVVPTFICELTLYLPFLQQWISNGII